MTWHTMPRSQAVDVGSDGLKSGAKRSSRIWRLSRIDLLVTGRPVKTRPRADLGPQPRPKPNTARQANSRHPFGVSVYFTGPLGSAI